jgi:FkbM family methyltransferase
MAAGAATMTSLERQSRLSGSALALKVRVARAITSDPAGRIIGTLTRNQIRHHGLCFDSDSADFTPRVRAQMFWGVYESAETRMIHNFLRGSTSVVELGSSLGITTAHIAAVMAQAGHLVCVEANPSLMAGLRERVSRPASSLRVQVIHAGVADHCGVMELALASETVGSRLGNPRTHETTVQVPTLTLREILNRTSMGDFDLVSDIEGSEAAFLLQDPGALGRCRRAIIELHDTTVSDTAISISDLLDAARTEGFYIMKRHGPVVALGRS